MVIVPGHTASETVADQIEYPTSDGRPMGETDLHRDILTVTIETLKAYYAGQRVYVSGNLLLFYKPGNRRRHVSPDVMVVKGVEQRDRDNYLLWQEGRSPNVVIEITSASTRDEDLEDKFEIYRDAIGVAEYFLFDPREEHLHPPLQGYRLSDRRYVPIEPVTGRLPSVELGLSLEAHQGQLRFYDPAAGRWLPTPEEALAAAEAALAKAEQKLAVVDTARAAAEAEAERLRREVESLRRQLDR